MDTVKKKKKKEITFIQGIKANKSGEKIPSFFLLGTG